MTDGLFSTSTSEMDLRYDLTKALLIASWPVLTCTALEFQKSHARKIVQFVDYVLDELDSTEKDL